MVGLVEICSQLGTLKQAIICSHVSPDADALGSAGALQMALSANGVDAKVFLPEKHLPDYVAPLCENVSFIYEVPEGSFEALIVVDTASAERINGPSDVLRDRAEKVFNIDHHGSNVGWGDVNYIDSDSPSTSVIVLEMAKQLDLPLSPEAANLLLAGLMDDTGCFRFSNTTTVSFEAAARMLELGASAELVANILYFSVPERVLTLRARAMSELELVFGGKVSVVRVTQEMMTACGASALDSEGIVDLARSVEGTIAAVFFREREAGVWKISLRAKDERIDVNEVAAEFDGGGHRAAAGASVHGTFDEAKSKVLEKLFSALSKAGISS